MAQHSVRIRQVPEVEILHKDLVVAVDSDGELLGTLTLSKGGVGWIPSNGRQERHFNWEQFARMVHDYRG
jgi:hypothetical protein